MLFKPSSIPLILKHIESLQLSDGEVAMILFGENGPPDIPALIEALNSKNIPFFGGVFPGLIYGNHSTDEGCIIKKFRTLLPPFAMTGIAGTNLYKMPSPASTAHIEHGTAIVLLDGLMPNIYRFLEKLNELLGGQCNFIGGGAGSISLKQQPCVFTKEGFEQDAAVVCVLDKQIHLGVRHGWEQLAGPLVATQTEGNTILQLNWERAIDVYNNIVEKDCGIELNKDNFGSIAQGYPFGILREKEDDIVRDPLAIGENGAIICIGEVPTNTVLHVLKGSPEALLAAARKAVNDCGEKTGLPIRAEGTFVVDCVTRTLFLDKEFSKEMNLIRANLVVSMEEQEPFGVLSLGEISSYGDGLLELFNKTIVIGTFY
ncbi:MAG: FIST signal transduction protein [Saprospiraceae bacterium]